MLIPETKQRSLEELSGELSYISMPDFGHDSRTNIVTRPHGMGVAPAVELDGN
jgi:hypothetical protein